MKSKAHKGLYDYAGRYKYLTFASLFLSGASAVLALMPFVYIWFMIRDVIDAAPNFAQAENLAYYGWMAVLFAVLAILVYVAGLMCSHIAAFRVAANIRKETLDHVVKLPVGAFDEIGSGKVRKIIDESSAATETHLAHNLPDLVGAIVTPLAMIAMMFVFDWRLGLASLFPVVCAFLIMTKMTGAGMEEKMKQYNDALMDMNNEAVEYVRGVPVVKTFGQTVFSFARFKASIDRYHKWVVAYTKQLRQPMMFFTLLIDSIFAFLIAVTLFIVGRGPADTAFIVDLVFYIIFTPILVVTLNKIMFMSENGMIVRDAMARINGVLDIKPLPESAHCESPEDNSVELKGVSFRYPNAEQNAVSGLNIKIGAGQTVALVGESGGGKTTVAGLVSRFWDVNEGEILIGGVNVKNIAKKVLSEQISYVFQDSRLLKASVFDNVRLSRPNASVSEVENALRAAQCDDIIAKLPDGIYTVIGKEGIYLSGGEQQRIAIARAILKDAPIVVLDEATAFADPENEYMVQKAFEQLTEGKTVLMIAHRLTTVVNADRIYVLQGGRVAESGTHAELLGKKGVYASMWNDYRTSVKWNVAKEA